MSTGFFVRDFVNDGDTSRLSGEQRGVLAWVNGEEMPSPVLDDMDLTFVIDLSNDEVTVYTPQQAQSTFYGEYENALEAFQAIVAWYQKYIRRQ